MCGPRPTWRRRRWRSKRVWRAQRNENYHLFDSGKWAASGETIPRNFVAYEKIVKLVGKHTRARARERELSCWLRRKTIKMWFYKQKTPSNIISETDINIKCDYWRVQLAGYILMCAGQAEETHTLFIVNRDEHAGGVQTRKTSRPISHSLHTLLYFFFVVSSINSSIKCKTTI